jgi:ABC-type uncharacterized transport system auxiliary subunit
VRRHRGQAFWSTRHFRLFKAACVSAFFQAGKLQMVYQSVWSRPEMLAACFRQNLKREQLAQSRGCHIFGT